MNDVLKKVLRELPGAAPVEERHQELWMDAPRMDVPAMARLMREQGFRLATMTGVATGDNETEILYHYARNGECVTIKARTRGNSIPSIAPMTRSARWIEREIHDFFGVVFEGHPDLRRLLLPPGIAPGYFREPGGRAGKLQRKTGGE
jgi:NADH:ubiquinone oxidoreductase subunit C